LPYNQATMKKELDVSNLDDLDLAVKEILERLESVDSNSAQVLALYGDLGAGKTTFVQTLGRGLGIEETITSPTFVIMKLYETEGQEIIKELVHIDAYRIELVDEMRVLGFAELLQRKGTIICIEWADKISELLPPHTFHLNLSLDGDKRILKIDDSNAS